MNDDIYQMNPFQNCKVLARAFTLHHLQTAKETLGQLQMLAFAELSALIF
jgi:hypothetical protein